MVRGIWSNYFYAKFKRCRAIFIRSFIRVSRRYSKRKKYFPGDTVAYIGGSGRDKNLEAWSPHLHLSYYKYEASLTDIDIDGDTISIVNIKNLKDYLRNPFNHKSESWKGTEY